LRWHVLLRKPTIVERLDCERLPTNRAHVRRGSVYTSQSTNWGSLI
jgi:hypothetical protein